jgi:hypothetical protein
MESLTIVSVYNDRVISDKTYKGKVQSES